MVQGLRRFLLRPALFAVPFALFFTYLQGEGLPTLGSYYIASLIFSFVIHLFVEANRAWVVPHLVPAGQAGAAPPRPFVVLSYGLAPILGSVASGAILHYTIAPGAFGSERAVVLLLLFSVLFSVLFLGVIYAAQMKQLFVRRIAEEAEAKAREQEGLRVAAEIQQALLPPRTRDGPTFGAAGASIPCRTIGGDFFEYVEVPGGVGFALGDVAGKGPPAAILAAMVQGIFATQVGADGPAATLTRVNRALCRRPVETRFATIAYLVLSPDGTLRSCSGGHHPAILLRPDGSTRRLERGGLPMGAFEEATYEEERVQLGPGDTVILYSDGVPDAVSPTGESFGEERLLALLGGHGRGAAPEALLDRVLHDVQSFCAGQPPADDVTVLVVQYRGAG